MNKRHQYKPKITFGELYRYALGQQTGGRPVSHMDLEAAYTRNRVENAMLALIKRRGLLDVLLADLGLCSLCQGRQRNKLYR